MPTTRFFYDGATVEAVDLKAAAAAFARLKAYNMFAENGEVWSVAYEGNGVFRAMVGFHGSQVIRHVRIVVQPEVRS